MNVENFGYVIVTDYVKANTGEDVSDAIQKIINENPHRTIYFPDCECQKSSHKLNASQSRLIIV